MNVFETSAIVEEQGRIHLAGVPFAPGTQVEVTISSIQNGVGTQGSPVPEKAERLLAALDKGSNGEPIGAFQREEVYDRLVLR